MSSFGHRAFFSCCPLLEGETLHSIKLRKEATYQPQSGWPVRWPIRYPRALPLESHVHPYHMIVKLPHPRTQPRLFLWLSLHWTGIPFLGKPGIGRNRVKSKQFSHFQQSKIKTTMRKKTTNRKPKAERRGVILVFILVGLACIAIIATIIYRKWQARQRGLQRF
ncbi:AVN_collapsed_G0005800.mRNA.1.CDS.1 [Saccharomyces cerevisiae]|nr:ANM_HP_G0119690.mRNA.1.CDS.1 [Saccharomyces cerevisiae]CAI5126632.1 ANM_HP_G0223650.mRNA.1.CDS.1 [Saccharomyces cerevisiae]CAI5219645.1 ANM_HP_G0034200.mRNA.1.CDS.1 [Saccharomyces cerevisiae]CAI5224714.1 ANM_HP_G0067500.mRNA.1.CDS.1 [Saccharomyces cerevisiae]CAI5226226.1 ANM_HP_G0005080.mRNA.1.CDS.1 [Saccharomyces cerevisiae]